MKSLLFTIILLSPGSVSFSQENIKSEIAAINKKYTGAVEQGDTNALKEVFDDEMIVTGAMGRQRGKRAEIADLVSPGIKVYFFKIENESIRVFENTAVTTGFLLWRINSNGNDRDFKMVFTFTYAKTGKDWKIVAQHIGRAPI